MPPKYEPGQKVDLEILRQTDLGFVARINDVDEGLLYANEVFERLDPQQRLPGYVKKVREDGGIDLILQAFGNLGAQELGERILEVLKESGGFMPVNASTPAEEIYKLFGLSKKKFKIALGALYKKRVIVITEKGIEINKSK